MQLELFDYLDDIKCNVGQTVTPSTRSIIPIGLSTFGLFLNLNGLHANVLKLLYLHHISMSYQCKAVCTVIPVSFGLLI